MIAENRTIEEHGPTSASLWCYLVSLGGRLYAIPDDDHTVLLPYISAVPQITPLPAGLVPAYVLGLINVAQRGELLVDLPRLLGLRDGPLPPSLTEGRRVVVLGEGIPPAVNDYRLAFAVDFGYELAEVGYAQVGQREELGDYSSGVLETARGEALLLNMGLVCNKVLQDMDARRLWNEPEPDPELAFEPEPEPASDVEDT